MQTILLVIAAAVLAVAAYGDVMARRIPNAVTVAVMVLGLGRLALIGNLAGAGYTVLAAVAVFAVSLVLFWRGIIGGGDAKLLIGATLLVGYHDLFDFLFLMSLSGALLAVALVARRWLGPAMGGLMELVAAAGSSEAGGGTPARPSVPYGAAIAAAAVVILALQTFVPR